MRIATLSILSILAIAGCERANNQPTKANESNMVEAQIGYIPIADHMLVGLADMNDGETYENLDLEPLRFTNYPTMSEALRSGDLDGAFLLAPLAFQMKISGAPVKLVLLGHRDGSGLVVSTSEPIKDIESLNNKTVAIPHRFSTNNFLLHMHATEKTDAEGGNIDTIEAGPPEMFSALNAGSIDGYITAEPFLSEAEFSGKGEVLIFTSEIWKGHPDCVLVLREEFIDENPEAVQELITSLVRAANRVEADRSEAAEQSSEFLGKSFSIMQNSLSDRRRVTFYDLVPNKSELARMQDYMAAEMGLFPRKVDLDALLDTSFATEAYRYLETNK